MHRFDSPGTPLRGVPLFAVFNSACGCDENDLRVYAYNAWEDAAVSAYSSGDILLLPGFDGASWIGANRLCLKDFRNIPPGRQTRSRFPFVLSPPPAHAGAGDGTQRIPSMDSVFRSGKTVSAAQRPNL